MHWIYIALFPRPSKTLYIEGGDLTHHHQCLAPTRGHLHFELEIRGNVKEITLWSEYITCEQPWNSFCSSESKEHRRHFLHSAGLGIVTPRPFCVLWPLSLWSALARRVLRAGCSGSQCLFALCITGVMPTCMTLNVTFSFETCQ